MVLKPQEERHSSQRDRCWGLQGFLWAILDIEFGFGF